MSQVVIDTNVLASGFVRSNLAAAPVQVLDAWRARAFSLVISAHILTELTHTLNEPYFRQRMTPEQTAADLALLQADASLTLITVEVHGVATHPEDDVVLATAVSAQVDYLVTGDIQLQKLGISEGITILSPRAFLDLLHGEGLEKGGT